MSSKATVSNQTCEEIVSEAINWLQQKSTIMLKKHQWVTIGWAGSLQDKYFMVTVEALSEEFSHKIELPTEMYCNVMQLFYRALQLARFNKRVIIFPFETVS